MTIIEDFLKIKTVTLHGVRFLAILWTHSKINLLKSSLIQLNKKPPILFLLQAMTIQKIINFLKSREAIQLKERKDRAYYWVREIIIKQLLYLKKKLKKWLSKVWCLDINKCMITWNINIIALKWLKKSLKRFRKSMALKEISIKKVFLNK
jgi:hypothetical protein